MNEYSIEVNEFHKAHKILIDIANNLSSYKMYKYHHMIDDDLSVYIESKDLIIFNCTIIRDSKKIFNIIIDTDKNTHSVYDNINNVRLYKYSVSYTDNGDIRPKLIILSEYIDDDICDLIKYMMNNIFNDEAKNIISHIGMIKSVESSKVIKEFIKYTL